ncbi:hypothetical protein AQUCO_00201469v1 [Aquilegia coerulea]|uniref:TROVE domain-containing protein n=1 Tax=Aquilegia coerulea TaxID=218851 RepID=A0A2G5F885_AQUCA|nr:hypothetical protein AQUCO_00201469v1 [Aquilegia coerulea]
MPQLLGPPELYPTLNQVPVEVAVTSNSTEPSDVDTVDTITDNLRLMGLTENCSPTFLSTGNPCLDFFFHVVPDTPNHSLIQRLVLAWRHNSLTALKLICQLRGVRGTGKADKEGFYVAALWLHEYHPKTLALNVRWFAEFGYLKDLLEILYRILEGVDVRKKTAKRNNKQQKRKKKKKKEENAGEKKTPGNLRNKRKMDVATKALQRYINDSKYRFLHDKISDVFAELLLSDIKFLKSKQYGKISLAAKWCPSLDSSYDRSTLICESIARKVFPRDCDPEYEEIEEAHYAYRVRDRLRKEVLAPLRRALQLPEVYMSAKKWNTLPYKRVASVAMTLYKKLFMEHDSERFNNHLQNVRKGKSKIAAGALLPHKILDSLDEGGEELKEVAELQWQRMVEDLSVKGILKNCLAVCDVSGSMRGLPMKVCIALGLLVSELSDHPWKAKVITFSENPTLQIIKGDTLEQKKAFVQYMDWGMNTDFQKVFDLILRVAVKGKLRKAKMIKRVFVFSDMEFDEASANDWETDYQAIKRKFIQKGYGSAIPEIVFWNLRHSSATPVSATQDGVALVSGYSKNLLKLFLKGDGPMNPVAVMESAISGAEYKNLNVFD